MSRRFIALLPVLAASTLLVGPAQAQSGAVNVSVDGVQRVSLRGAAASVVVANPQIADVVVVDANTLVITGKGYGVTEVVAVDAIGRSLFQNRIVVTAGDAGTVRLWRGAEGTEMVCGSSCAPSTRRMGTTGARAPSGPVPGF